MPTRHYQRLLSTLLCALLVLGCLPLPAIAQQPLTVAAEPTTTPPSPTVEEGALSLSCRSAVLMDAATGTVLYTQNPDEALPPASVTKIMTLLLVMQAIDEGRLRLSDPISVSANAASMGGSQVYLEEGETMSCEDMLKSVVISSANDAAVALAEHLSGDVGSFVDRMNQTAAALGMANTHFENATGLDDTAEQHLTSARDIAIMSRELIRHDSILDYSSRWMDSIRNGAFGLTNTNRLVRFYRGATGLKTGSTDKAGFCVSATAERDGLSLICVIMGAPSRDVRNAEATRLLDWGFANFSLYCAPTPTLAPMRVTGGELPQCTLCVDPFTCVLDKGKSAAVEYTVELDATLCAPVEQGRVVGSVVYTLEGQVLGSACIRAAYDVPRVSFATLYARLLACLLLH